MGKIVSKKILEDVRFANDIAEVIGSYFTLKRAGSTFKACCPFHKEKTPSFTVSSQRQSYHCFGCSAGGDVFGFLMKYEGVDFMTSVKMLAQRAGIAIELEENDEETSDKNALYKINSEVSNLYNKALTERQSAESARQYLKKRGLTDETIESFQIGYAPNRWDSVLQWIERNKINKEIADKSGLIMTSSKPNAKSKHYDRFRNRLMFPILDEQSRVVGFSGRTMEDDPKAAKYVNSPETPLFHKGRILYALNKARKNIVQSREALVCEGQIDVIRCHQAGFNTAVASQGTAFTDDHVRILSRYADSVCIIFDPDKAGQDAAIKAATLFMYSGLAVRIVKLPDGEDPDSFILNHGAEAFQAKLDKAMSLIAFQVDVLSGRENMKSEIGIMRVSKEALKIIAQSPNAVQRAKLVQEAAGLLNLPATALQDDLRFILNKGNKTQVKTDESAQKTALPKVPKEEEELCEHLVHVVDHPELEPLIKKYLPLKLLRSPACRLIIKTSLESLESGEQLLDLLRAGDASEDVIQFAAKIQMAPRKVTGKEYSHVDAVKDYILAIWKKKLKKDRKTAEHVTGRQNTYDLKALNSWETGSEIIELES